MTNQTGTSRTVTGASLSASIPISVSIELDHNLPTLRRTLGAQIDAVLTSALDQLQRDGVDAALLSAIVQRLPSVATRLSGPGGVNAWLTAVREVTQQARHCTLALLESSEQVLRHASPAELLMWTRLGLRQAHRQQAIETDARGDAILNHFELRSRESALILPQDDERVDFADNKQRLKHLLRALFDVAPELMAVEQGLATRRPFLSNLGLHLPEASRAMRGPLARRWFDAAAAHAAAHLQYSSHQFERGTLKPIQMALLGLLEDARVEAIVRQELPGLGRLWRSFHPLDPPPGDTFVVLMLRLSRCLFDSECDDPHPWVNAAHRWFMRASRNGRAADRLAPALLREMASKLGNDIGQMRLQFNHRDYVVEPAYRDDNAYLWQAQPEATPQLQAVAEEVPLAPTQETTHEIDQESQVGETDAQMQAIPAGQDAVQAAPLAQLQYPEWDRLVGSYRNAWCTVLESRPLPASPVTLQQSIERHGVLLGRIERVLRAGRLRERIKLRAQLRGDELDLDAAVRAAIERSSQRTPGQKVHQRSERRQRDLAALVLLDTSTSTGDVLPLGRTVLDLGREAALLTTHTLVSAGDCCAIDGFCSNGRHQVRYESVLAFDEPLDAQSIGRLAGLKSQLSTRMGAALRHATEQLAIRPQRKRLLLFVTDGEPHDVDIHDRHYLVEDARRAVFEANHKGVTVFCVSLDSTADSYVRTIFGIGNYRILDRIESLPQVLPPMVLRLTR